MHFRDLASFVQTPEVYETILLPPTRGQQVPPKRWYPPTKVDGVTYLSRQWESQSSYRLTQSQLSHLTAFKSILIFIYSSTPRILDLNGPKFNSSPPSNFAQVVSRRFHCASNAQGSSEVIVCIYLMIVKSGGLRFEPDQSADARPRHPSPLSPTRGTNEPFIGGARHVNQITSVTYPSPHNRKSLDRISRPPYATRCSIWDLPRFRHRLLNAPEPTPSPYFKTRQLLENSWFM
jgi:hypothetical protein